MVNPKFVNPLPKHLRGINKNKKILNLGCGDDTFGTARMDFVKTTTTTHVGDIQKRLPFRNNEFDIVYMSYVFEHLTSPGSVLKEVFRILKRGGMIILLTDNAGFWGFHSGRYTRTLGTIHYGGYRSGEDCHVALYTPEHINNHLRKAGFKVKKIKYLAYSESRDRALWKKMVVGTIDSILNFTKLQQIAAYGIYAEGIKP